MPQPAVIDTLIERMHLDSSGLALYDCASVYDDGSIGATWRPHVCLKNGSVSCDCPHFHLRLSPLARRNGEPVNIATPAFHCRHITAAVRDCIGRGEISLNLQ